MIPQEEFRKIPRVLIWGQGLTAGETASRLKSLGYEVITVNPDNQIQVLDIKGFAGDFQVSLRQTISPLDKEEEKENLERRWTENVGAIVFAPELVSEGNYSPYRLTPSSQIITLEELTAILFPVSQNTLISLPSLIRENESGGEKAKREIERLKPDSYIAFLVGLKYRRQCPGHGKGLVGGPNDSREISISSLHYFAARSRWPEKAWNDSIKPAGMRGFCFSSLIKKVRHC